MPKAPRPELRRTNLFQLALAPAVAHAGIGEVLAARFAVSEDLAAACNFLEYVELPPGTSIGDHRHTQDEEEFYLVLAGEGRMRLERDNFKVRSGDLIRNPPGGLHGLTNTADRSLQIFVFELPVRRES
jgi:quercetin dioxygenase-like cupin family protein